MRFQKSLNTQFFVTVFTFFFFIKQLCVLGVFHSVFLDGKTSLKKLFIFEALKIHTMHFSWLARWLAGSLAGCLAGSLAGSLLPTSTHPAPHLHPRPSARQLTQSIFFLGSIFLTRRLRLLCSIAQRMVMFSAQCHSHLDDWSLAN